ncbi:S8 family serine peptidase, partial [Clostridium perfringens]|uniref:S8 family serine peptidase n=1 Tax=Clostridium perfringens TaxID=1502 RepID=UPI0018E4493F
GHGTHVAGTIAAMGNNALGLVGVNWTVMVMALKFLDSAGNGSNLDAALAVRYAADRGARVSNNSYAGGGGATLSNAIAHAGTKGS